MLTTCAIEDDPTCKRNQLDFIVHTGGILLERCIAHTGSSRTILSREIYERLEPKPEIQSWSCPVPLCGIGGGELWPLGIIPLKFYIGDHLFEHPVVVTEGSPYELIVGTDSMRPRLVEISLGERDELRIAKDNCPVCQ